MRYRSQLVAVAAAATLCFVACSDDGDQVQSPTNNNAADNSNDPGNNSNDNGPGDNNSNGNDNDSVDVDASIYEGVICGEQSCEQGELCCTEGFGINRTFTCIESDAECAGNSAECDDTGDCAEGSVCCGGFGNATCESGTTCPMQSFLLCAVDEHCPDFPEQCCNPLFLNVSSCGQCF